jgi:fructose-1,6-bisphosphatase/inositol monophosphatase family enzyme
MYCTTPDPMRQVAGFERLRQHVQWTVYGGDCISYALVASGTADLVVDRGLKPYDWCALVPIVTEAGGVMVDWEMAPLGLGSSGAVITAASRELAQAASAELVAAG